MMRVTDRLSTKCLAWLLTITVPCAYIVWPTRAEAAALGSASASAGSAPPPAMTATESFQPDLFTGRATTAFPIVVPPGRKGMQPSLALGYSSTARNGWVGVGWALDLGAIERSTKNGPPRYDSSDTYVIQFQGMQSELVQIPDGSYRAKDEGLFLKMAFDGTSWDVRDKSGTQYLFGTLSTSRLDQPSGTFRWCLEKVIDTNGNFLEVSYTADQGMLYPAEIRYTGHAPTGLAPTNRVTFLLEDRPDSDTSYRSGSAITIAKRLQRVETYATVGGALALARRYALAYTPSARTGRSLLTSVTQIGSDGTSTLPPTTFTYTGEALDYLHCHNCVPSISSGNHGWQLQSHVGNLFPRDANGNDQRLWPGGGWESGQQCWTEQVCQDVKTCRKVVFWTSCDHQTICSTVTHCSAIPQVSWSSPQLELSGSRDGVSWTTDTIGNLTVSGPQDAHILAMTWLYTDVAKTVSLSGLSASGRADVFYVPPEGTQWLVATGNAVPLQPGWTVLAVTAYHETGALTLMIPANLATQVTAMNHAQFLPMSLTGDFNGDSLADIAHLDPGTNHWHVARNGISGFGPEETWLSTTLPAETVPLMGDVNADGLADLILWNASSGLWQVAQSTGTSFAIPSTWHSGFGVGHTPFMGDFNGDQWLDVGTFTNGSWQVALSTGSSFGSPTTWLSGFGSGATPLIGDVNGDGLTDVAVASGGTVSVALSDGTRFVTQPAAWIANVGGGQPLTAADLNGDGLTDIVYYDKATGTVVYAPSTGRSFGTSQTLMSDHPFGLRGTDDTLQVGDFRGTGLSGFGVFNALSGAAEIAFAMGHPTDVLTSIANGLGGTTTLTYEPSSALANTSLPFALPVVTHVATSDGMGHTYTTTYSYAGGLYDAAAREFRGFQTATATDAVGTTTATTFAQDLHAKGRPLTVDVRDSAGRLYTHTANTWSCTESYPDVHFTHLDQTEAFAYDGDDTVRQTRSRLTYDTYGNVTAMTDEGQVTPALEGDERITTTSFTANAAAWIVNRPQLTQTLDAAGTVIGQRRFTYDGTGNLAQEEEWLSTPNASWLATTITVDPYGNVATVTDALGRATTNTYDETTHTYLTQIANVLGHTRTLAYDARLGVVTNSADLHGQITQTRYDAFGRVTKIIGPTDTEVLPTVSYEYDLSAVPTATVTRARVQSGEAATLDVYTFTDGLGRTIQTRSPAEDLDKHVVSGAVTLDSRGLVSQQWVPYLEAFATSYVPTTVAGLAPPITYTYDPVGRLTQMTAPDGSVTATRYNDGVTITTDANGHETWHTQDVYGRLVTVDEVLDAAGTMATTTYAYDALNNLLQVADATGNVTTITYDSLGRKVEMDDPDMGHWTYAYDAVDNLISQTDARGVILAFTYDALNRLIQKSSTVPVGLGIVNPGSVTYTYDNPAKAFSKGKLTEITDRSGSSSFAYDLLGRLITESKTIDGTTYTVARTYDLLGRLIDLTYPDGEVATYTYNPQGGIETVTTQSSALSPPSPVLSSVDYNAAGQLTKLVYGNGVVSDYTYHPQTLRVDRLVTSGPSGTLQDFTYGFDPVGNVSQITDAVHTGTQLFQYDALNRLTQTTGSYGTVSYAYDVIGNLINKEGVAMTYGLADGSKPHAVTATAADSTQQTAHDLALSYDANGNLLAKTPTTSATHALTAQTFAYDAENRLTTVKTAPTTTVTLTLQPGWNFFSLPVIPEDLHIAAMFPNFSADFEQLAWFDAAPTTPDAQRFKHFVNQTKFNDFEELQYGQGYQLYCKNPNGVTLALTGKLPTQPPSTTLLPGWHLLPATSTEATAVSRVFGGIDAAQVLAYDTTSGSLTTVETATPGAAYFVEVRATSVWTPLLPQDPTTTYVYDGDGGRVQQVTSSGTMTYLGELYEVGPTGAMTKHLFAGSLRLATVETPPGQQVAQVPQPSGWWPAVFEALAFWRAPPAEAAVTSPTIRFYHPDHLGSTNLVTDGIGAVVEHTEHLPYGAIHRHAGEPTSPHQFTGQRQDLANGLILFPARPYDPALGRFLQPDPFVQDPSDPQLLNRYSYARNNPVTYVDPSGHFVQFLAAIWAAIMVAAVVVFAVAATVSVIASTVSLIASATGHERTAQRAARVATVSGQVAFWSAMVFTVGTAGEGSAMLYVAGGVLAYANMAAGVARDTAPESAGGADLPFGVAFGRQFLNAALTNAPGVSQLYGAYLTVSGANPLTQEQLSPIGRVLLGGAALAGLAGPTSHALARRLPNASLVRSIETPYGPAYQSTSAAAKALRRRAIRGARLYRGGKLGTSKAAEGQFWAPENPVNPGFASKYGAASFSGKPEFVIGGTLKSGADVVTRQAPGFGNNLGGELEGVTNAGDVRLDFFHMPD